MIKLANKGEFYMNKTEKRSSGTGSVQKIDWKAIRVMKKQNRRNMEYINKRNASLPKGRKDHIAAKLIRNVSS